MRVAVAEPVLEGDVRLAEVLLAEHVLVPDDELDDAEAVGEGEEDGEVKGSVGRCPRGVDRLLHDGRRVPVAEERHQDEAGSSVSKRRGVESGRALTGRIDRSCLW